MGDTPALNWRDLATEYAKQPMFRGQIDLVDTDSSTMLAVKLPTWQSVCSALFSAFTAFVLATVAVACFTMGAPVMGCLIAGFGAALVGVLVYITTHSRYAARLVRESDVLHIHWSSLWTVQRAALHLDHVRLRLVADERAGKRTRHEIRIRRDDEHGSALLMRTGDADCLEAVIVALETITGTSVDREPHPSPTESAKPGVSDWQRMAKHFERWPIFSRRAKVRGTDHEPQLSARPLSLVDFTRTNPFVFFACLYAMPYLLFYGLFFRDNFLLDWSLQQQGLVLLYPALLATLLVVALARFLTAYVRRNHIRVDRESGRVRISCAEGYGRLACSVPLDALAAHLAPAPVPSNRKAVDRRSRVGLFLRHRDEERWLLLGISKNKGKLDRLRRTLEDMLGVKVEDRVFRPALSILDQDAADDPFAGMTPVTAAALRLMAERVRAAQHDAGTTEEA